MENIIKINELKSQLVMLKIGTISEDVEYSEKCSLKEKLTRDLIKTLEDESMNKERKEIVVKILETAIKSI